MMKYLFFLALALPMWAEEKSDPRDAKIAQLEQQLADAQALQQFWTQSAVSCQVQQANMQVLQQTKRAAPAKQEAAK